MHFSMWEVGEVREIPTNITIPNVAIGGFFCHYSCGYFLFSLFLLRSDSPGPAFIHSLSSIAIYLNSLGAPFLEALRIVHHAWWAVIGPWFYFVHWSMV